MLPHWRPPHPKIWYQSERFFNSLQATISSHTTFLIFFWGTEKRKTHTKLHFTELNHCWSRLVGCTSPCDRNHSKWALLTTFDSIMLHQARRQSNRSLDAIQTFVVTACSGLGCRKQTQSVLHSVEPHSRGPVDSVPLIVAINQSRIGLDNWYMICNRLLEICTWNWINQYSKPTRLVFKCDYRVSQKVAPYHDS